LLDRFDLRVGVNRPDPADLLGGGPGESSAAVRDRVVGARLRAAARGVPANAALGPAALEEAAPLGPASVRLLEAELHAGRLSARGLSRVRGVALTIGDLEQRDGPLAGDLVETALSLRIDPFRMDGPHVR